MNIESYKIKAYDKIRYCDTDRQGHVNNSKFYEYLETGRVELLYHPERIVNDMNCSFVVASLHVELLAEMKWPGIVEIGTSIDKVGKSSITLKQGLFYNNRLTAIAETVVVQVDNVTKKSSQFTEECKKRLYEMGNLL